MLDNQPAHRVQLVRRACAYLTRLTEEPIPNAAEESCACEKKARAAPRDISLHHFPRRRIKVHGLRSILDEPVGYRNSDLHATTAGDDSGYLRPTLGRHPWRTMAPGQPNAGWWDQRFPRFLLPRGLRSFDPSRSRPRR